MENKHAIENLVEKQTEIKLKHEKFKIEKFGNNNYYVLRFNNRLLINDHEFKLEFEVCCKNKYLLKLSNNSHRTARELTIVNETGEVWGYYQNSPYWRDGFNELFTLNNGAGLINYEDMKLVYSKILEIKENLKEKILKTEVFENCDLI